MKRLLLIELNEINFDFVRDYAARGLLPNLARLLDRHGVSETTSEARYEELEPWIQWVTAHTGLSLAQHGVFRLGDIVHHDIPQIWEQLEDRGLKVGAVSPMNAKNRTRNACFFVPDPWTRTDVTGGLILRRLYDAIAQAVNDNAEARITAKSAFWLVLGMLLKARPVNYLTYARYILSSKSKPWTRALILDLLLADVFIGATKQTTPDFATLFLNAGAHIQHHYMFSSSAYSGALENPSWYISRNYDPILEIYQLYDRMIGQIEAELPDCRLMIATGLHQNPHEDLTFYWRLRDHATFLKRMGVPFQDVSPRMSRDFLVSCASPAEASEAERVLARATVDKDKLQLFEIDNRGSDLFVALSYPNDIPEGTTYSVGNVAFGDLRADVAFVAVKNGEHDGIGYFLDTGAEARARFPLSDMPQIIEEALAA